MRKWLNEYTAECTEAEATNRVHGDTALSTACAATEQTGYDPVKSYHGVKLTAIECYINFSHSF